MLLKRNQNAVTSLLISAAFFTLPKVQATDYNAVAAYFGQDWTVGPEVTQVGSWCDQSNECWSNEAITELSAFGAGGGDCQNGCATSWYNPYELAGGYEAPGNNPNCVCTENGGHGIWSVVWSVGQNSCDLVGFQNDIMGGSCEPGQQLFAAQDAGTGQLYYDWEGDEALACVCLYCWGVYGIIDVGQNSQGGNSASLSCYGSGF
jgi:hypothetical protein